MLRTILLVLAAGLAALLVWVGMKPATYHVERSAVINAAPAEVYGHVYDLAKWEAWSPWAKLDPNSKVTFEGPTSGPGAIMRWAGNEKVGRGAMAITEAKPAEAITIRLDFVEPMEGTSTVGFQFQPKDQATEVVWSMSGDQGFVERLLCTVRADDHLVAAREPTAAGDDLDLVLLHQAAHAAREPLRHLAARVDHRAVVGRELLDREPRYAVLHGLEDLGGRQDRLGGNAAPVQAHAAQVRLLLDDRDLHAQLRRANRGDVPAGPGTDHDQVERLHPRPVSKRARLGASLFWFASLVAVSSPLFVRSCRSLERQMGTRTGLRRPVFR